MIELANDQLTFSFPTVHPDARLVMEFQRTLRIPGGEGTMPRLPSLGRYPLYDVEEFAERVPRHWLHGGGAMLPMYQSEAMWLSLRPCYSVAHQAFYPFAVKVRVGGLDAVRGQRWSEGVQQWPQNFLIVNDHCWLGGYHDGGRGIRQFVAMPLGSGYLPEDTDNSPNRFGCLEVVVYPMRSDAFALRYPRNRWTESLPHFGSPLPLPGTRSREHGGDRDVLERQQIEEGLYPLGDWSVRSPARYSLHLANSLHWCAITGSPPPMAAGRVHGARRHSAIDISTFGEEEAPPPALSTEIA